MRKSSSPSKGKQRAIEPALPDEMPKPVKGSETKVKKPEKIKLRRLHVSGLPDLTEQEAKDRFKSFGEVVGVDGLGKLDATGKPLRYAFFDIKTTKSKLSQCMNLLSGSVWKGSTLRIAEAKPTFMERLEQERKQAAKQQNTDPSNKKDKKRKRDNSDETTKADTAEPLNSKSKPGWKLDPKTQTPIFPVIMRPDHPLPPPVHDEPIAGPSEPTKNDKATKASKKAEKAAKKADKAAKKSNKTKTTKEVSLSPPTRARMVKIDPTQWAVKHLREPDLQNLPDTSSVRTKAVSSTSVPREVKIQKAKQTPEKPPAMLASDIEDDSSSSDEDGETAQTAPNKPTPRERPVAVSVALDKVYDEEASLAERQANLNMVAKLLGGIPKDLQPVQETIAAQGLDSDMVGESESESSEADDSIEAEDGKEPVMREDEQESSAATTGDDEDVASGSGGEEEEELINEEADVPQTSSTPAETPATEYEQEGPSSKVEDGEALESGSTSSSSQSGRQTENQEVETNAASFGLADVQMQSLTDMFKPQETAAGFTIGDLLDDFEVDELETITPVQASSVDPTNEAYQSTRPAWSTSTYIAPPKRVEASSNTLFFPFPLEEDELPGGLLYDMNEQDRERVLSRSRTGVSTVRRFKRTQTIEEITSHHESVRKSISEQVRKRHREAVKKQKRHGGKRITQSLVDEA